MRPIHSVHIFLLVLLAIFILTACSDPTVRLGWSCVNWINKLDCNYRKFSGREVEVIRLAAGEKLTVLFDVKVVSGVLVLEIQDPNGETIWEIKHSDSCNDRFTFSTVENSLYHLIVEGRDTTGSYLVEWVIENDPTDDIRFESICKQI